MVRANYKVTMRMLMEDLSDLLQKKESLEDRLQEVIERIATVREAAWGMKDLSGIDPDKEYPHLFSTEAIPDVGFTDAIREVFRARPGVGLTPVGVRNKLKERGFKLENYTNPLASIHTILKRLEKQDELHSWQDDEESPTTYFMTMPTNPEKAQALIEAARDAAKALKIAEAARVKNVDSIVANPPYKITRKVLARAGKKLREQQEAEKKK
jgi:hypothetical protein